MLSAWTASDHMDSDDNRMSECICPIAGYCERHKVLKTQHWHKLCQTREEYRALWEAGKGPGCTIDPSVAKARGDAQEQRIELCRALWLELHSKENPSPEWFANWVGRVPNFGCGCRSWLREYLRKNPPRYDDFYAWSVEVHNAVNVKLGRPIWTGTTQQKT
jgi:hypothetical protein